MKLKNPPIIESVCEFRFDNNLKPITLLYETIKGCVVSQDMVIEKQVDVLASNDGNDDKVSTKKNEYPRFVLNENKTMFVIVKNNVVSIHRKKIGNDYPEWKNFCPIVKKVHGFFTKECIQITRFGFRNVNILKTNRKKEEVSFSDYFNFNISNALWGDDQIKSFTYGVILEEETGFARIRFADLVEKGDSNANFLFDMDFFTTENILDFDKWLNDVHKSSKKKFEEVIKANVLE
ncbi:MAG: TIGR04255 family protein [Candidatus Pacebacteria bacterium]|nr:TIGR04255 family protein [Candidatus Paceibacterota bacterium]